MRRTMGIVAVVVAVTAGAVALGFTREQGTPEGTPPLQRYHITPGDLPVPTSGVANPPEVVDKPAGAELRVPPGFSIDVFADGTGFQTLRNLIEAPNGDLFAADFSANTITLLRDTNNDGKVDERKVVASGLSGPFGMAISNGYFYVGNTGSVVRWKFAPGDTTLPGTPEKIATLPSGGGHVTRSLAFSEDGSKLYVTIGSASNVDVEQGRALIRVMGPDGTGDRVFASGLRNPVGLAIRPGTDEVWAGVHERDMLGDDLVPDYVTRVQDGGFYGWPLRLYRTERGSSSQGRAAGPREESDRARRAAAVALGADGPRVLHRLAVPGRLPHRCLPGPARLVEPQEPHRLQGRSHHRARRQADWRIRGLRRRVVARRGAVQGVGTAGGDCRSQGRIDADHG